MVAGKSTNGLSQADGAVGRCPCGQAARRVYAGGRGQAMTPASAVQMHRVTSLDGLRAIAVLMVFLVHIRPSAFPGGYQGVMLFFALSGFLITSLLLQEWEQCRAISLR